MIKNINILLLISILFLSSCGDNVEYSSGENPITEINYPTVGDGTFMTPYMIGSGLYEFKGEKYYSIDVRRDDCNVLLYGVTNFNTINNDAIFIDAGQNSEIEPNSNLVYEGLDRDRYNIIVNSRLYSKFGLLSTCIDESYGSTKHIKMLLDNDRKVMKDNNILYKFIMPSTGTFSLNTTGDDIMVRLYNNNIVSVYTLSSNRHNQMIPAGEYYILLSKISKNDVNFVFNIDRI
ncbi:hypothetical protein MNB_SV-15-874 [hydrothermal vent metagenome]|uniref:Uncharacterized protein n=1 Tax=hydrothermal vent metagenome TaxID=652676 RepID=A0A1W1EK98_9ZZZZ